MSNVLMGIIGVILFIGLALAGALILGDDFKSSTAESKAAEATQMLQQMSHAAEMYRLKTGLPLMEGDEDKLVPRFLKQIPANPMSPNQAGYSFDMRLQNGMFGLDAPDRTLPAKYVTTRVISSAKNIAACKAMNAKYAAPDEEVGTAILGPVGCRTHGNTHYIFAVL